MFTKYLKVIVLLHMCAGLTVCIAQSATGMEVAVLMDVALDPIGYALVQVALDIDMFRALILETSVGRESKAIHLHLTHAQRLRLHLLQAKYVLHDVKRMLQPLLSIRGAIRCIQCGLSALLHYFLIYSQKLNDAGIGLHNF